MFPVLERTFLQDSLQTGCLLGLSNRGDLSQDCPPRPPAVLRLFPPSDPSPSLGAQRHPPQHPRVLACASFPQTPVLSWKTRTFCRMQGSGASGGGQPKSV